MTVQVTITINKLYELWDSPPAHNTEMNLDNERWGI
jgi:hypothetical protein